MNLKWQPALNKPPADGTHDYLAIVRIPHESRGFSAKVYEAGSVKEWVWEVWRHGRSQAELKKGLAVGRTKTKDQAVAKAEAALSKMMQECGF